MGKGHKKTRSAFATPKNSIAIQDISSGIMQQQERTASASLSPKSAAMLNRRHANDIQQVLDKLNHDVLNYEETAEALRLLSLKDDMAGDLWDYLDGERRSGVTKQALTTILLAIMDSKSTPAGQSPSSGARRKNSEPIGSKPGKCLGRYGSRGEYSLTQAETQILQDRYARKVSLLAVAKSSPKETQETAANFTFTPHISSRSNFLAGVAREKLVYNATQEESRDVLLPQKNMSIPDLSAYHASVSEVYLEKERAKRMEDEKKECTFFPKTNSKPSSSRDVSAKRCDELCYGASKTRGRQPVPAPPMQTGRKRRPSRPDRRRRRRSAVSVQTSTSLARIMPQRGRRCGARTPAWRDWPGLAR